MRTRWVKAIPDDLQPHVQPRLLSLPFTYPLLQQNGRCVLLISICSCVYILFSVWKTLPWVLLGKSCLSSAPQLKGFFMTNARVSLLSPISPSSGCLPFSYTTSQILLDLCRSLCSLHMCLFPSVEWKLPEGKHSLIYVHAIEPRTSFYAEKGSGTASGNWTH